MPQNCARTGAVPQTVRFSVVAGSKSRQEQAGGQAAATSAARRAMLPTLCSVDYQHQHIDMITRGAPSSSRSNDPWPSHLGVWRSYRNFDLSNGRVDLTSSRPMQRPLNRPDHHTLSLGSSLAHADRYRANVLSLEREQTPFYFCCLGTQAHDLVTIHGRRCSHQ